MVLLTSHKRRDAAPHPTKFNGATVVDCPGRPAYMGDNFNSRRRAKKFPTFTVSDPRKRAKSPHWVPAPGKARRDVIRKESFPLCLVCDRRALGDNDGDDNKNAEALARKCEAQAEAAAEAGDEGMQAYYDYRRGERQRLKAMRGLWEMDGGGDDRLKKWHEILTESAERDRKKKEEAEEYQRERAGLWVHERPETTFRPIKSDVRLKRESSHRRSIKTKRMNPKSPRKHESDRRSKQKTHFNDERSKDNDVVGDDDRNRRNLTESLVEERDKVAHKEAIGNKRGGSAKSGRKRRSKGRKEEELLKCLELIEMAKDKLLLNDEEDDKKEGEEGESTNVSASLSSGKDKKKKAVQSNSASTSKSEDFFAEVIIDELKAENLELRSAVDARDRQLKGAADKIRDMVEENARLAERLEMALSAAKEHAEVIGERIKKDEEDGEKTVRMLKTRIDELEARESLQRAKESSEAAEAVGALRSRLEDAERKNRELQEYVDNIKASYTAAFGDQS